MQEMTSKEWALKLLDGGARSCVRRVKSISVTQLRGMERAARSYGISAEETAVTILKAANDVPNPDPDKLAAVRAAYA
jgi:hypothetical protein